MVCYGNDPARSARWGTRGIGRLAATFRSWRLFTALLALVAAMSGSALVFGPSGPASAAPSQMTVNAANWSGYAGWGSRFPAWDMDSQLVVHFQGAVRQISTSGPDANLLGWTGQPGYLNAGAPNHNLFTVVHTGSGTYADLVIKPSGEIWLMPSPNTNSAFVSLEGISYYDLYGTCQSCVHTFPVNATNWSDNAGWGSTPPGYYVDNNNTVHLAGAATRFSTQSGSPNLIATLPLSLAPWRDVYTIVHTGSGSYADLDINPLGQIWLMPSPNTNTAFVSLESITYSLQGFTNPGSSYPGFLPLTLNPTNWSPHACCNSTGPGWYKDNNGIVHLIGAVTQLANTGGSPNFIGTLPYPASPTSYIYTIVHTGNGTYADLVIGPNGQIWLMPATGFVAPGVPAHTDTTFVSLESITFQP
jgi:hypothetical protein